MNSLLKGYTNKQIDIIETFIEICKRKGQILKECEDSLGSIKEESLKSQAEKLLKILEGE